MTDKQSWGKKWAFLRNHFVLDFKPHPTSDDGHEGLVLTSWKLQRGNSHLQLPKIPWVSEVDCDLLMICLPTSRPQATINYICHTNGKTLTSQNIHGFL